MARHGISSEDVINAANTLKGQGKSVTIENIRNFLGTGSSGTINQHLRRWKEAQQTTQKITSKEKLPEGLVSLVKGLWEGVLAQTTEQFMPIETSYQQEISELKAELEKYRSNNQRWQKMFNQWQQEKTALANENLTLEQALEFAHKENQSLHGKYDGLLQQLQDKQERIDELHRLHKQAQENLEHYRESAREQRLLDQQQNEQQKQNLQSEIKTLNEQIILQYEKNSEQHQRFQLLQHHCASLEDNYKTTQVLLEQAISKFEASERDKNECLQLSRHWQNQSIETQKKLNEQTSEFVNLQADIKVAIQQLEDAKHSLIR